MIKISQEIKIDEISNPFNLYRIQVKEEVGNEVNDYEISCQYLDDGVMCEILFLFDFVIIAIGPWCASGLSVGEGRRQERGSGQRRWREKGPDQSRWQNMILRP